MPLLEQKSVLEKVEDPPTFQSEKTLESTDSQESQSESSQSNKPITLIPLSTDTSLSQEVRKQARAERFKVPIQSAEKPPVVSKSSLINSSNTHNNSPPVVQVISSEATGIIVSTSQTRKEVSLKSEDSKIVWNVSLEDMITGKKDADDAWRGRNFNRGFTNQRGGQLNRNFRYQDRKYMDNERNNQNWNQNSGQNNRIKRRKTNGF